MNISTPGQKVRCWIGRWDIFRSKVETFSRISYLYIKSKLNMIKLIFKKNFCFPKFPLFNPLASFDLNLLEKGWAKYFKNGLKSFHISHPSICTVYLFWGRTLIQMSSPDRGELLWNCKFDNFFSLFDLFNIQTRVKIHHSRPPIKRRKNSARRKNSEQALNQPLINRGFFGVGVGLVGQNWKSCLKWVGTK